jgi:hypothetical protein
MKNRRDKKRKKEKERDIRDTPKLPPLHHQYHKKFLGKINLTIPKKITNGDWSGQYALFKGK